MMNNYSIISKALNEVVEARMDEYMKTVDPDIEIIFSDKYKRKMRKLIERQKKPYFKLICTTGRRIACAAAAIIVIFSCAMSVEAVREAVREFLMYIFGGHTAVYVNGNVQDYPSVIEEEYEIAELPEGFEVCEHYSDDTSVFTAYMNGDKYIFLHQMVYDVTISNIDNEHSNTEIYIDENGQEYLIQDTGNDYCIIFNNGKYIIRISSNLTKKGTIDLCEHTKIK